jgi:hypothetical protein
MTADWARLPYELDGVAAPVHGWGVHMSDDGGKSSLGNPLPLLMVVLLAAGVFVKNVPLQSARPTDPERARFVPLGVQDVEARLWQDPFAAVDKAEERAASAGGASPERRDRLDQRHSPDAVRATIETLRPNRHVTILAVSVFGGSYAQAAENRRRTRFAVISALGFHDYRPANAEAIGYFRVALPEPRALAPASAGGDRCPLQLTVPYEWFEQRRRASDVLVLWLNEDKLTASPIEKLRTLFARLTSAGATACGEGPLPAVEGKGLSLRLVGPAGSAMLAELVHDRATAGLEPGSVELQVFAPGATVSSCDLFALAARLESLPAMDFPLPLVFVTGLALAYALYTAVLLRKGAESARARALEHYETRLLAQAREEAVPGSSAPANRPHAGNDPSASPTQIRLLMDRIRGTREGAFASLTHQPALQALLLPFGGYGGAQLIDDLMNATM